MSNMRPGVKIRFWSPHYKNAPGVEPPGLLKLAAILSIFSIVGVLVYSVAFSLTSVGSAPSLGEDAVYVAILHFVLPVGIIYTVVTNSPLSRPAITLYVSILCAATFMEKGFFGNLQADYWIKGFAATIVFAAVIAWLYGTAKMRVYYAMISGLELPSDLERPAEEIIAPSALELRLRQMGDIMGPIVEILAVIVIIAACIYAFALAY